MIGQRVIIIEDDHPIRQLMSALLEMEGFQIVSLDSIEPEDQTLKKVKLQHPDLVITDVFINGKGSFDFIEKLKQQDECSQTKVLMSSGMAVEEECLQHGADGFLLKPYMPDELIMKINHLLERV